MPAGADEVSGLISGLGLVVQVHGWKHNHNNCVWVCKPDSSCGIEVCSPVIYDSRLGEVAAVLDALAADPRVTAGDRCSFHVHVDVSPFISGVPESSERLCSILAWWIKCEPVMMDSVPDARRNSRFCRCIGLTDLFDHDERVMPCLAVNKLKEKYLSLNTHHLVARKRNSIEFRILEGTKDSRLALSWVDFVLNFVDKASRLPIPDDYRWLSLEEVLELIDDPTSAAWLVGRMEKNMSASSSRFWSSRFEIERAARSVFFRTNARAYSVRNG